MKILNRKNELVDYNEEKLFSGIAKASLGTKEEALVIKNQEKICQAVLDLLGKEVKFPTVVDITNIIPRALIQEGFVETAEKFLVYATKHKTSRCNSKIDPVSTIDEYINKEDWRIKANANQGYSVGGMILNSSGKISANYWLDNIYPEDAGFAHRNGDIHIHDLACLMGYCFSKDTKIQTKEYGNVSLDYLLSNNIKNFTVLSKDKNGKTVEGSGFNLRKTRENTETLELEFEDGSKVVCTPDHKFLLKSGIYKAAKDLTLEDELAISSEDCNLLEELNA